MSRMLTLIRRKAFTGCAVTMDLWLNGSAIGSLGNGKEMKLMIPDTEVVIRSEVGVMKGAFHIPAGSNDVELSMTPSSPVPILGKVKFEMVEKGSSQSKAPTTNELDAYRQGGALRLETRTQGAESLSEAKINLCAVVAADMLSHYSNSNQNIQKAFGNNVLEGFSVTATDTGVLQKIYVRQAGGTDTVDNFLSYNFLMSKENEAPIYLNNEEQGKFYRQMLSLLVDSKPQAVMVNGVIKIQ